TRVRFTPESGHGLRRLRCLPALCQKRTLDCPQSGLKAISCAPPMKSESGFLNTRHDTEPGDVSAASPGGRKKSAEGCSPRSNSARVAASKPLRSGQGRTIGAVTVTKLLVCLA